MKISQLLVFSVMCTVVTSAQASGDKAHGGFAYRQSIILLEDARDELTKHILPSWSESCLNDKLAARGLKPIRLNRVIQALKNMRMSYSKNLSATNPSGEKLPLMFSYGKNHEVGIEYIEALQPYFMAYMSNDYARQFRIRGVTTKGDPQGLLRDVQLSLLHEATHLFEYSELDSEESEKVFARPLLEEGSSICP